MIIFPGSALDRQKKGLATPEDKYIIATMSQMPYK